MIHKLVSNPGKYSDRINGVLLLLRQVGGLFMLTHGAGKFTRLFAGNAAGFPDPIGIGSTASLALTVFAEIGCAILLIAGLSTRFAATVLSITMLVAALVIHADDGFKKQELPLMYLAIYVSLLIAGAGKFSLDKLLWQKKGIR